jgi:hypothetical protein
MNVADKAKAFSLFEAGWDVSRAEENYATLLKMGEGVLPPPGSESDKPYSRFMAIYAALCRYHMKTWGTTQRQIAAVSAKNHTHSVQNPYSQFRKPITVEEILAAPPITYPLVPGANRVGAAGWVARVSQNTNTRSAHCVQSVSRSSVPRCAPSTSSASPMPRASRQVPQTPISPLWRATFLSIVSRW